MRGRWVQRPWGRLRVWEEGRGPILLAVHGLGGSGRYWEGLAALVGDRYRVVAPDLSGFGASDKPDHAYDRDLHLGDLDAALDGRGPSAVVGHSLGGVLGLLWSGRHPSPDRGLAMAASPFPAPRADWDPSRLNERRAPALVGGAVRVVWPVLSLPVLATRRYPRAVVRDYGRQTVQSRVWTLWSLWSDPGLRGEVEQAAADVGHAPVTLLHADDDRRVDVSALDRWRQLFPNAEVERIAEGGHQFLLRTRFAPLEQWLRSLPGPVVGGRP